MSCILEYPLGATGSVRVEVTDPPSTQDGPPNGPSPVTRGRFRDTGADVLGHARDTFEGTLATIRPVAEALRTTLAEVDHAPDDVTVEFGVQLSAQAGAVIASLGSATNFKITMTWRRPADGLAVAGSAPSLR